MVIRVDYEAKVILVTIQKIFSPSYENIISILTLVTTAFLSRYKIPQFIKNLRPVSTGIILIFALVRTAFFGLYKMVFLEISQNSQENTCARASGLQLY